jgi:rod shape-determining protein MreC
VVTAAFPAISYVRLVTDSQFGAGVISQNHRLRGVVKGQSPVLCTVEYVQNEGKIEVGEWFYTSGDDLMFPKGIPVGQVTAVRPGASTSFMQISLAPSGLRNGPEEVLIVLRGVHQPIPAAAGMNQPPALLEPPPVDEQADEVSPALRGKLGTDADRILEEKRLRGATQGHVFGTGTSSPDFNAPLPRTPEPVQ